MIRFKKMLAKLAIPAFLVAAAFPAHAENVYKSGSEGDVLYKKVQYLLPPEVVPVFIPLNDKVRILNGLDAQASSKSGLTGTTVAYFMSRIGDKLTAKNGVTAYALTGSQIPGNANRQRFCGIVFTSEAALKDEAVLTHEAIHCKNAYDNGTDAYRRAALPAWQMSKKLTARQFMGMLDEAIAGGLQVAYAYNSGKTAALPMVKRYASHDSNGLVSIGYRTARGLLEMCGRKDACPTDTVGMINKIVQNKAMLNALMTDMFEIQALGEKAKLVVFDQ